MLLGCGLASPDLLAAPISLHVDALNPRSADTNPGTEDAPLKTLGAGLRLAKPGTTVRVAEGVYRESLELTVSGTPDAPLLIEARPGERVVLRGADPITGWQPGGAPSSGVWMATIDWMPVMVFVNGVLADEIAEGQTPAPGQVVRQKTENSCRLLLGLAEGQSPSSTLIEGSRRSVGFFARGVSHVTVRGLEVSGFQGSGIGFASGTSNTIDSCVVYHCRLDPEVKAAFGLSISGQTNSVIRRSISVVNSYGIAVSSSSHCLVEDNISGRQTVDAMGVNWRSSDIVVRRNYVFDNWDLRHPDGFQTYRDVRRLTLDSNAFVSVGQGWQCQETQDSVITNNLWAGIHWMNAVSCSLRHSQMGITNLNLRFTHNTFFGGDVLTGGQSTFLYNVTVPPSLGGCPGGPPLASDFSLMWTDLGHWFRWTDPTGKNQKSSDLRAYQRATGTHLHSLFAAPRFRHGPSTYRTLFQRRNRDDVPVERERLFIGNTDGFAIGDHVEVDCDGVPRRITSIRDGYLVVSPSCTVTPKGSLSFLWNWKSETHFDRDLRLAPGSPGHQLGAGSSVSLPDYRRGDFNGDGLQDVPPLPEHVLPGHPLLALATRPTRP